MAKEMDKNLEQTLDMLKTIWPKVDDADQHEIVGVIKGMAIMAAPTEQPA